MGTCVTCRHPDREAIDAALVAGRESLRSIAARTGVSRSSLARHKRHHLQGPITVAAEREGLTLAALAADLGEAHAGTLALFRQALERGDRRLALAAARELRGGVMVLAQLAGVAPMRVEVASSEPVPLEVHRQRAADVLSVLHSSGVLTLTPGGGEPGAPDADVDVSTGPRRLPDHEDDGATADGLPTPEPAPVDGLVERFPWLGVAQDGAVGDLRHHF